MPYVSAQYAPPAPPMAGMEPKIGDPRRVIATDDQGVEWHLTEDSQVGDWLRYIEADGKITAARDVPEVTPAKKGKRK